MDPIHIDLSSLKVKDLALFERMQGRTAPQSEIIGFLDRVVVGGASELPLTTLPAVMQAITEAMAALGNPKDGQGKA
jgi:hypothetical protein